MASEARLQAAGALVTFSAPEVTSQAKSRSLVTFTCNLKKPFVFLYLLFSRLQVTSKREVSHKMKKGKYTPKRGNMARQIQRMAAPVQLVTCNRCLSGGSK